jgi:5S rRNA maturation endonuclease (ribonuclease M5)
MRFAKPKRSRVDVDVARLIAALGIEGRRRGDALWACCPMPGHGEKTASWSIVADRDNARAGAWYCFGCGEGGGPARLAEKVLGVTPRDAWKWLEAHAGVRRLAAAPTPVVEIAPRIPGRLDWPIHGAIEDPVDWPRAARRYFEIDRAFPLSLARDLGIIATDGGSEDAPRAIVIPVHSFGALRTWVARSYIPGQRKHHSASEDRGAQPALALWGEPRLDPTHGPALVCEGVFDALSLFAVGLPNAVAVLGASNATQPAKLAAIARCPDVIICMDNDEAGERAAEQLSRSLARHCRVARAIPPKGHDFGSAPVDGIFEAIETARAKLGGGGE